MSQLTKNQTPLTEAGVRTPWWKRVTAVFTLSSMVVFGGLALAGVITLTILMVLYLLEQAIA